MRRTPLFFALLQIALAAKRADDNCNEHCNNALQKQNECGGSGEAGTQSQTLQCLCNDENYWSELAQCNCSNYDSSISAQDLRSYYCGIGGISGNSGNSGSSSSSGSGSGS